MSHGNYGKGKLFFLTLGRTRKFIPPAVVQGGGEGWMEPHPGVFDMLQYFETILPSQWKAFGLLNKMRYVLGVVALLDACDDFTKNYKSG